MCLLVRKGFREEQFASFHPGGKGSLVDFLNDDLKPPQDGELCDPGSHDAAPNDADTANGWRGIRWPFLRQLARLLILEE